MEKWITIVAFLLVACEGTLETTQADPDDTGPVSISAVSQSSSESSTNSESDASSEPAASTDEATDTPASESDPTDTTDSSPPDSEPDETPPPEEEMETLPEPGSIVEFEIAQGTGSGAWNTADAPVVVYVGQVLRVTNFDDVDHQMHATNDAPVPHGGNLVPGQSEDYVVTSPLAVGSSAEMWDHGFGRSAEFWVEALEYPSQ